MTFRMPAEWAPHDWTWIGFPTNPAEWPGAFDGARQQIAAFTNALHCGGKGEQVRLVAVDPGGTVHVTSVTVPSAGYADVDV